MMMMNNVRFYARTFLTCAIDWRRFAGFLHRGRNDSELFVPKANRFGNKHIFRTLSPVTLSIRGQIRSN